MACGGLAPVLALAERAGLDELIEARCTLSGPGASGAVIKVPALVMGMVAGADSIDDMDLLRHGAMGVLCTGIRAPSTLGTFLRAFTFGHVRQLDAVASRLLAALAGLAPLLPVAAAAVVFCDVDDTIRETHGYAKEGAGYGYSKVKGLNALIATISTPTTAPVIAGTRSRKGTTNSARGADRLIADALVTARRAGIDPKTTTVIVRMDSAFFAYKPIAAVHRGGARFSVTARMNKSVRAAIAGIGEDAWTPIHYPNAFTDESGVLVSDAEVAEIPVFTAFTSRRKAEHVTGRLIVRRVRRLNPATAAGEQDALFTTWRYHAVFTDSPMTMLQAEAQHRGHAIIEQVIADLKNGPLAHLPSGRFNANAAWLVCAAMAFNLTRAAGALASVRHAKASTGTIRTELINVPARLARTARTLTLHLPTAWPWQSAWEAMFTAALHPPPVPARP